MIEFGNWKARSAVKTLGWDMISRGGGREMIED